MQIRFRPYTLELKHAFAISGNSRITTPVILTELEHDGLIGYGEASLPPYLPENQDSVMQFLGKIDLSGFNDPQKTGEIIDYVNSVQEGNRAAKAAFDIALHDLAGKTGKYTCYSKFGADPNRMPDTTCTIGMDSPELIKIKVSEARPFKILKIKLGGDDDRKLIQAVREVSYKPLTVDANQGWKDKHQALDMIHWLRDEGVRFIEQPMPKTMVKEMIWLTENSPLPTIADESCQDMEDLEKVQGVFKGINIKLMKCGGMSHARKMITRARELDLKIMIGCMNESSCAIMAAAALAPLCNWADLDGPFLIKNNPFEDPDVWDGKIVLTEGAGLGLIKKGL